MQLFKHFSRAFMSLLRIIASVGLEVIVKDNGNIPISDREALLILPGFGSKLNGTQHQKRFFAHQGFDLFIPQYISRTSLKDSIQTLDEFIEKHHLKNYRKVHVFAYIVGSWAINEWILANPKHNIATIIYDRSPLQERAPAVLTQDRPLLMRIGAGPILKEFSKMPYPSIEKQDIRIGIIVESKATAIIRQHKKTTMAMGALRWDLAQFQQTYDDAFYTWLNHDEMYMRFDVIGDDVLYFIKNGRFTEGAKRKPLEGDPFMLIDLR